MEEVRVFERVRGFSLDSKREYIRFGLLFRPIEQSF